VASLCISLQSDTRTRACGRRGAESQEQDAVLDVQILNPEPHTLNPKP
jgi:hypothetical protein